MHMKKQVSLPLAETLDGFLAGEPAYFCIPGHRMHRGVPEGLLSRFGEGVFRYDLTEANGLDDLHNASGAIAKAQAAAAALYGADRTRFLVNGTTCGLESLILALCRPDEEIILARNAHQSVISGLVLSGAKPVWILPRFDAVFGFCGAVDPASVRNALAAHQEAKAVLIVSPTYQGQLSDISAIARICHDAGVPLVVDEAHGAHLYFSDALPKGALACGADAVVMSTHKTAGSMTQSSLLHLKGNRIDPAGVDAALRMLMSSSPSYVLMTSLDAARAQLEKEGAEMAAESAALGLLLRRRLEEIPYVRVYGGSDAARLLADGIDATRVVFSAADAGISGFDMSRILYEKDRIALEMADARSVTAVVTWANDEEEIERLVRALAEIVRSRTAGEKDAAGQGSIGIAADGAFFEGYEPLRLLQARLPEQVLTPRQAYFARRETVPFSECRGRISAGSIAPYPPGIPVVNPGERIDDEAFRILRCCREYHIPVHTFGDGGLDRTGVIAE